MFRHRFRHAMTHAAQPAFIVVPLFCLPALSPAQWSYQQALYQWAYEQAQLVVRPSILERDLLGVWN